MHWLYLIDRIEQGLMALLSKVLQQGVICLEQIWVASLLESTSPFQGQVEQLVVRISLEQGIFWILQFEWQPFSHSFMTYHMIQVFLCQAHLCPFPFQSISWNMHSDSLLRHMLRMSSMHSTLQAYHLELSLRLDRVLFWFRDWLQLHLKLQWRSSLQCLRLCRGTRHYGFGSWEPHYKFG